ncbi:MAG: hypothetical protein BWX68_01719 [Verrucomicrobia bacterium ADurb.Bin063]|nr:MAG: hypothetical protein BWX68_01719 [Verrucomicrobia bacterium ADurb.Bin063]
MNGAVPEAATVNVAFCPWVTVWLSGCVVMVGGTTTVSSAPELVAIP